MRNIKITIQFDGTAYHGWQIQSRDTTVQQTLCDAVSTIVNEPVKVHGSGRTDAGVHALGQVAHFQTASGIDPKGLVKGINSRLPDDIVITRAEEVSPDFHARFSAKSRVYWYTIWNTAQPSPFFGRYSWHIIQKLDVAVMQQAAETLIGVHDFSSFQGADKEEVQPVREVFGVRFKRTRQHILLFEIHASSFLKHMVRNIVGTLADVGRGKVTPHEFTAILEARDRTRAGAAAPACGLFLKEVRY